MLLSGIVKLTIKLIYTQVETAVLANYMTVFTYSSPSNTIMCYNTFSGSMHTSSMSPDLGCCSLHTLGCVSCYLLITVSYLNACSVKRPGPYLIVSIIRIMAYSSKHKRGVTWELPTNSTSLFENDEWWVQYPVINAVLSPLNRCNSFNRCRAIVVSERKKEEVRR